MAKFRYEDIAALVPPGAEDPTLVLSGMTREGEGFRGEDEVRVPRW